MKRIIGFILVITLFISMVACGLSDNSQSEIHADEGLFSVSVIIPKNLVGDDATEFDDTVSTIGIDSYSTNDDGSVTLKMSKRTRNQLLLKIKDSVDSEIQTLVGEAGESIFSEIKYNKDMTSFSLYVEKEKYNTLVSLSTVSLLLTGMYYQIFNGVEPSNLDVKFEIIDNKTNEVIDTY